jgi:hypothetical protein
MGTIAAKITEESMGVWEYGSMGLGVNCQLSMSNGQPFMAGECTYEVVVKIPILDSP